MSVNALRKQSSDVEVITLAKSLIKSWKKLLGAGQAVRPNAWLGVPRKHWILAGLHSIAPTWLTWEWQGQTWTYNHLAQGWKSGVSISWSGFCADRGHRRWPGGYRTLMGRGRSHETRVKPRYPGSC